MLSCEFFLLDTVTMENRKSKEEIDKAVQLLCYALIKKIHKAEKL